MATIMEAHWAKLRVCALAPKSGLMDLNVPVTWMMDRPTIARITIQVNSLSDNDWMAIIMGITTITNSATEE